MPYITKNERLALRMGCKVKTVGQLNCAITMLIQKFMNDTCPPQAGMHPNYAMYNDMIGVLECCKLELYRRMVAPYEDVKCAENGDVYDETNSS
jgi:hypothetical protein